MTAVTHEQFSVPHGHKIITKFINKMNTVNGEDMKAIEKFNKTHFLFLNQLPKS